MVGMFMLLCATDMNECQAWAGSRPPVTLCIGRKSSLPIHTPATSWPV